jgi:hypothetical protein
MLDLNDRALPGFTFLVTGYLLLFVFGQFGITPRGSESIFLITILYLITKPKIILHPANVVFANYLIYLLLPSTLYLIYKAFEIEYVLPWGLINDWSELSQKSFKHYEYLFVIFYLTLIGTINNSRVKKIALSINNLKKEVTFNNGRLLQLSIVVFLLLILFIKETGGINAWYENYSDTYTFNKVGIGPLNVFLIWAAHFLAFILGYLKFILRQKISAYLLFFIIIILLGCIALQGFKSRIPLIIFFYLSPVLINYKFKISHGLFIFVFMILLFLFGMYFRSHGFYSTPRLGLEYLQSYFNTIFLHDKVLIDYSEGSMGSILIGFNKFAEIFNQKLPRENYDLAVLLTQKYYPVDWLEGGSTQQWPLETDLYLSFPNEIFWIIPVVFYCLILHLIAKKISYHPGFFLFVYSAEAVRIMSIYRSSFLVWDVWVTVFLYIIFGMLWRYIFSTKSIKLRKVCKSPAPV